MIKRLNLLARDCYLSVSAAHGYEEQEPACEYAKWYHLFWLLIPICGILIFMLGIEASYNNRGSDD